jgi:hypothetical protein
MRRPFAIAAAALALLCGSAGAGTVNQGFHVTVDLNRARAARLEAPAIAVAALAARPYSIAVRNALVVPTFPTQALRLKLEIVDPAVASAEILGLGKPVHVEGGGASVLVPSDATGGTRTLSYVLHYAHDERPHRRVPLRATLVP